MVLCASYAMCREGARHPEDEEGALDRAAGRLRAKDSRQWYDCFAKHVLEVRFHYLKGGRSRYHKWNQWINVEWPQLLREIPHQVAPATIWPRTYGIEVRGESLRTRTYFKCNVMCEHYIGPKYLVALDLSGNDKPTLQQIVRLDLTKEGWDGTYQCGQIDQKVTYIRLVCIGIVTKDGFQPLKDWKQLDGDGVKWQAKGVAKWRILTNGKLPEGERCQIIRMSKVS
jgi:hypothetical protein